MKKWTRLGLLAAWVGAVAIVAIIVSGCTKSSSHTAASRSIDPHAENVFSDSQMTDLLRATQVAATATPTDKLVVEGRRLFRSTAIARQGESCNSCHADGGSSGDIGIIKHPTAAGDFTGDRVALALWNVGQTGPWGWNGKTATLQAFAVRVVGNFFKNGATQPADVTAKQAAALVAYMQSLDPPVSPFDTGNLSADAKRGEAIFMEKCATCHTPPLFTDHLIHDIGVPNVPGATDPQVGVGFDTPQLRDIVNSAPYFHDGSAKTLTDVVTFYHNRTTLNLNLGGGDIPFVVAFLESL